MEDVIVIGGGPGGYASALYCARSGLSVKVLEKIGPGGQMANTLNIENYPGFSEDGINGYDLAEKMMYGSEKFGVVTELAEVTAVESDGPVKKITAGKKYYESKTVVISTGAKPRKLGLANEDRFLGRGIAYCATCDGMFYKGKPVAVVGGRNSAVLDALYLSKICPKVYIVHRRDSLRATKIYEADLANAGNIEILWNNVPEKIVGKDAVEGLEIKNIVEGSVRTLECKGIFVSVGRSPETELFKGKLEMNDGGYIVADETTRTNVDGVFVVGDVRTKPMRQVVTAVADGATSSMYVEEYIGRMKKTTV